jgi:hypothetical protein
VRQSTAGAFLPVTGSATGAACPGNAAVRRDRIEDARRKSGQIQEYVRRPASSGTAVAGCRSMSAHRERTLP